MATWCLVTRRTEEDYKRLTRLEREVWFEEAKRLREKGWI